LDNKEFRIFGDFMYKPMNKVKRFIKLGLIIVIILNLIGCAPGEYTESNVLARIKDYYKNFEQSEDYKKLKESWNVVKQVKILVAKVNQGTIYRAVKYDYIQKSQMPSN
jgi:hypothetical protein